MILMFLVSPVSYLSAQISNAKKLLIREYYWGDIYKDLTGGWIQKASLHELVISETTVPGMNNKINSVIERSINIKNGKQLNFEK